VDEMHQSYACVACIERFIGRHDMSYMVDRMARGRCFGCGRDDAGVHLFKYRYPWPDEPQPVCKCCGLGPGTVTVTWDAYGRLNDEPALWCRHCYDRQVQQTTLLLEQKVTRRSVSGVDLSSRQSPEPIASHGAKIAALRRAVKDYEQSLADEQRMAAHNDDQLPARNPTHGVHRIGPEIDGPTLHESSLTVAADVDIHDELSTARDDRPFTHL
jgi:hypothetical protein